MNQIIFFRIVQRICLLAFVITGSYNNLFAQSASTNKAEVKIIGRAQEKVIHLRWSANKPLAWRYATTYGYIIERITMQRDGNSLPKPESIMINAQPIKPLPENNWQAIADTNKAAAIIWQAIYGKSFEPTIQGKPNTTKAVLNQANELQQRFTFALLACDQSFAIAKHAAMGFTDTTVKIGEKYLYKIYTAIPSQKYVVDTGFIYIGLDNYFTLPAPLDVATSFGDQSVMLSWNYALYKNFYNSYHVERSDDGGKTFTRINKQPIVNLNLKDSSRNARMVYVDSLPTNDKNYTYRVLGVNAFGETSTPSAMVTGQGQPTLSINPVIEKAELVNDNKVIITWTFANEANNIIKGFSVQRSDNAGGYYDTLQTNITPKIRKIILDFETNPNTEKEDAASIPKNRKLFANNYFMITAIGKNGKMSTSFPLLVDIIDTFPPAPPVSMAHVLDTTTGQVRLQWKANKENDLLGYRVYKANRIEEVMLQQTISPISDTLFTDTISLNTLNEKVYYALASVDKRFNTSKLSAIITIVKPDRTPPSAPIISNYYLKDKEVHFSWINSSSTDVAKHKIYRKQIGTDAPWTLLKEITKKASADSIVDNTVLYDSTYAYTIIAIDSNQLESVPAAPLTVTPIMTLANTKIPTVENLKVIGNKNASNVTITWDYKGDAPAAFWLYRAGEDGNMSLLQTVDGNKNVFVDSTVSTDVKYHYMIKAVLKNGINTSFTNKVKVNL